MIGYKLFRVKKNRPGELFPLYVLADKSVPIGVWVDASEGPRTPEGKVKSKIGPLAFRPGWHLSDIPLAIHIGIKEDGKIKYMHDDEVWCECSYVDCYDYQEEADQNGWKDGHFDAKRAMLTRVPEQGFYRYKTSPQMLGKWIIWEILTVVTCGLFGFYVAVALKKWEYSHTYYMDSTRLAAAPGAVSWFDGSFASYLGNAIICSLLSFISCGIAYPWASVPLIKWEMGGTVVDGDRYGYFGNGTDMFSIYIVCMLLNIVTCGIYFPWATCRINRYIISNTHRTVRVR